MTFALLTLSLSYFSMSGFPQGISAYNSYYSLPIFPLTKSNILLNNDFLILLTAVIIYVMHILCGLYLEDQVLLWSFFTDLLLHKCLLSWIISNVSLNDHFSHTNHVASVGAPHGWLQEARGYCFGPCRIPSSPTIRNEQEIIWKQFEAWTFKQ